MILSAHPTKRRVLTELAIGVVFVVAGIFIERYVNREVFDLLMSGLVVFGTIGAWAFVTYYWRSNWRVNPATRALMRMGLSIALFLTLSSAAWVLDDYPGRDIFRVAIFGFVTSSIWQMLWTLRREQRLVNSKRRPQAGIPTNNRSTS